MPVERPLAVELAETYPNFCITGGKLHDSFIGYRDGDLFWLVVRNNGCQHKRVNNAGAIEKLASSAVGPSLGASSSSEKVARLSTFSLLFQLVSFVRSWLTDILSLTRHTAY